MTDPNQQPPAPPPPPEPKAEPKGEPKLWAGKYKTPEEMEAGYKNLETKLGGKPAEPPKPPETPAGGDPGANALTIPNAPPPKPPAELPDDATPAQILEHVGLKQEDVAAAWNKDKKLTAEQYAAFKAKGLAKAAVDAFLRGQEAEATLAVERGTQLRTKAETLAGGKDQLTALLGWAAENITDPAEKTAINARLSSPKLYEGAIIELKARQAAKNPPAPTLVNGGAAPGTVGSGGAFRTTQEMENAIAAAKQQLGETQWHKDESLMARIKATPQNLKDRW